MMDRPDYQGQIESGDYGPDTGHYHVFIEDEHGCMVPWTGHYTDSLCWTSRENARRGLRGFRGAVATVGQTVDWYDCPGNDETWATLAADIAAEGAREP